MDIFTFFYHAMSAYAPSVWVIWHILIFKKLRCAVQSKVLRDAAEHANYRQSTNDGIIEITTKVLGNVN